MKQCKKILFALGVGTLLGYTVKSQLDAMPIKPEYALKRAKERFKEAGPVSGSWIYMKTETLALHGLNYTVYRGGITRTENDVHTQYEFYVDAYTGVIVDTKITN